MAGNRTNVDRLFAFAAFVASRRAPVSVRQIAAATGYNRPSVYRLLDRLRQHVPLDLHNGVVTVRKPLDGR
jgi:DNA-binding IclR family transcriptional regulator